MELQSPASAELTVSDTGLGIPAAEMPSLFERFHRVRRPGARTYEGTGIGLALVQELVRLHSGEIRMTSTEGKGTTFTVTIPIGTQHAAKERLNPAGTQASTATGTASFIQEASRWLPERAEAEDGDDKSKTASAAKILVVEDNADMSQYIKYAIVAETLSGNGGGRWAGGVGGDSRRATRPGIE